MQQWTECKSEKRSLDIDRCILAHRAKENWLITSTLLAMNSFPENWRQAFDQVSNFLDKLANFPCPRTKIFRIFFGFQIVLYGGCDGGSCKKNQKSQCFVHFLIFLMVREWIYVDVDRPRYTFKKRLAAYAGETIQLFDRFIIFLS